MVPLHRQLLLAQLLLLDALDMEMKERLLSPVGPASDIIYLITNDGDCLELAGSYLPSWAGPQRSLFGRNIDLETEMREEIQLFRYRWL